MVSQSSDDGNHAGEGDERPFRVLRATSLSHQIAERLRNEIVHGRLPPGTRLIQDDLCERFGTSRMPVREALQQLNQEGLLERRGQQRVVSALSSNELREVHLLTAVLHGWAAGQAATLASHEEIAELAEVCQAGMEADDPYEWARLAMEFHKMVNKLARSQRLIRTLLDYQRFVPRTQPFNDPNEMQKNKERQLRILEAIQARDPDLAERRTREHGMMNVTVLMQLLEGQSPLGSD